MHYPIPNRPTEQYDSLGVKTSGVIYAAPCELLGLEVKNNAAGARYLFLHNTVAVPADGQPYGIIAPIPVPAGGYVTLDGTDLPRFTTGLCWSSSTTDLTKTITLAADMIVTARVRVVQW